MVSTSMTPLRWLRIPKCLSGCWRIVPRPLRTGHNRLHLPIGLPTMGGPLVTKRGVTFFSGSMDYYLRAIDSRSGSELWRSRLPVGSQAAPITYIGKKTRKQFVVVTAGGAQRSDKDRG